MSNRPRSCGLRASVLVIAALLGGCDSGGGGPEPVYFSMSNYEGCVVAYARLRLDGAGTEIARRSDGTVDCSLSPELAGAGCTLDIEENEGRGTLRAAVSGCRVPVVSGLFSCEFLKADLSFLNTDEGSGCGCLSYDQSCYVNGICDLCAGRSADRGSCEDCGNNRDDDRDGKVDCDDPDCELTMECGYGRTTISCQASTTTIPTTSTSTSVTMPPPAPRTSLFGVRD